MEWVGKFPPEPLLAPLAFNRVGSFLDGISISRSGRNFFECTCKFFGEQKQTGFFIMMKIVLRSSVLTVFDHKCIKIVGPVFLSVKYTLQKKPWFLCDPKSVADISL